MYIAVKLPRESGKMRERERAKKMRQEGEIE